MSAARRLRDRLARQWRALLVELLRRTKAPADDGDVIVAFHKDDARAWVPLDNRAPRPENPPQAEKP